LRQIATITKVTHQTVSNDVQAALDDLAASQRGTTEQHRALQLARIETLLQRVMTAALTGDLEATRVAASLIEQISKLYGLYGVAPIAPDGTAALLMSPMFGRMIGVFMGVLEGQPEALRIQAADAIAQLEDVS